ncbi:MAG: peptidoglycan DD-metalloendopeptidase family protein [Clostridiales bacterium]|nr:peptidoglycan DD-metalloendopeptidase family protein [Clostridiales bacterium]
MLDKSPRLRFTEEELENQQVRRAADRAEQVADKADAAKSKLRTDEDRARARAEKLRFGKKDNSEPAKKPGTGAKRPSPGKTGQQNATGKIPRKESGAVNNGATTGGTGTAQNKLKSERKAEKPVRSRLRFDGSATEVKPSGNRFRRGATRTVSGTASAQLHHQISSQNEDENAGVQAAHQGEESVEGAARAVEHADYSKKLKAYDKAAKLERRADKANVEAIFQQKVAENPEITSNPLSCWRQKQEIKKEYAAAKAAASRSAAEGAGTVETIRQRGESLLATVKGFVQQGSGGLKVVLICCLALLLLLAQLQSCSVIATGTLTTVTATAWPADDSETTKADAYYTKLEAQLQKKINSVEKSHSSCDEFNYDLGTIGHDSTALISYLCAKYGDFTLNQVKSELDAIFALQYDLSIETATETRTTTKTVRAGEYIGEVVTSGYCSCSICCGVWANGKTASGTTPTASHTLAVDASNPIVPIGTQIIMNGVLYTVEDTGTLAKYGVDFDVYYDSHSAALAHGHKTWSAYYAGGNGEKVTVKSTETVKVCTVTLNVTDFTSILESRLTEDETALYDIYLETKGCRVFFGTPLTYNWHEGIVGGYGYQCSGTTVTTTNYLKVEVQTGTKVFSVMDGTVKSVSNGMVTIKNDSGYTVKLSGLKSISVSAGQEVTNGQLVGKVGSAGTLKIYLSYNGTYLNPLLLFGDRITTFFEQKGGVYERKT